VTIGYLTIVQGIQKVDTQVSTFWGSVHLWQLFFEQFIMP